MRELERESDQAQARLKAYIAQRAPGNGSA